MIRIPAIFLCSFFTINIWAGGSTWAYEGNNGPDAWGDINPDYKLCKSGKKQSPINIDNLKKLPGSNIKFSYKKTGLSVVNNGHTIQVNVDPGNSIEIKGKKYQLLQFHFHSPSEHTIKGKHAKMVAHMVHKSEDGELTVLGVLMKSGKSNAIVKKIWSNLPKSHGTKDSPSVKIKLADLLPKNKSYFNYSGSLTTPPCSENVNWIVFSNQVNISKKQVKTFTKIFPKSVRPIQPWNNRVANIGD